MAAVQTPARIRISNILLPIDFSPASESVVPHAVALAELYGAKLFIAHAVVPEVTLGVPLDHVPRLVNQDWTDAQEALANFIQRNPLGIAHEEILERGRLWDVVSGIIADKKIDLLVLGTHGRRGFSKVILGSDAEKIFRQAACPVLTVGPQSHKSRTPQNPRRILFPTDFTEASLHALPYALSLAEENNATLVLLHLAPLVPWQEQITMSDSVRKSMESLIPEEAKLWCQQEYMVRFEFPVEGVLQVASQQNADLIVIGVRKKGGAATHLPWSIASEIVSEAPCPVLTVRG